MRTEASGQAEGQVGKNPGTCKGKYSKNLMAIGKDFKNSQKTKTCPVPS